MKFCMEFTVERTLLSSFDLSTPFASEALGIGTRPAGGRRGVAGDGLAAVPVGVADPGVANDRVLLSTTFCSFETVRN